MGVAAEVVGVAVLTGTGVLVVGSKVGVAVGVSVIVGVSVGVAVSVGVGVSVGVAVGVGVGSNSPSRTRLSRATGSLSSVYRLSGPKATTLKVRGP